MSRHALALVLLSALSVLAFSRAGAVDAPASAVAEATQPSAVETPRPEGAMVASAATRVLGPQTFNPPKLNMTLISGAGDIVDAFDLVDGLTFFLYYSASCPHCQHVAPEVARLAKALDGKVAFVGVGSGSNSVGELAEFKETYGLPFDSYKDYTRRFARDNNATSTPQLLLVRPTADGGFESLGEWRPLAGGLVLLAEIKARVALGENPFSAFRAGELHGSNACGGCHEQELRSWGLTHHSIAYWTLFEDEDADKPECVSCHVTGLGTPGGFAMDEPHSPLAEVGCEACHGAGGPHVPGARVSATAAKDVCVTCHDADHSVRFSVERALPHINHFNPTAFDPIAFRAAREDLVDGKAPRPMTAFPEGKNLGDDACTDCHKAEAKAHRKNPHSAAMKTLASRSSTKDMACIGCHSVEKTTPAETPKDFHDQGVGCESCHGPGEQHVAEGGGTENIVGLGESCPVCVVEAICTRCHTPEQDPDWDLEKALELSKHR
ncbi:MAG: redoxin domain-containing protein [Deltaproteobacteria bacterium]|nr:redoxin domain-containing protein [Deltaproteobacteria bacterium]